MHVNKSHMFCLAARHVAQHIIMSPRITIIRDIIYAFANFAEQVF